MLRRNLRAPPQRDGFKSIATSTTLFIGNPMSTQESAQNDETIMTSANTQYMVMITMPTTTVQTLKLDGFALYGFKAVQSSQQGAPLVWLRTDQLMSSTQVAWTDDYQAYTSTNQIMPGGQIMEQFAARISPGETLQIQRGGTGMVMPQGTPNAISFLNQDFSQYTVGISQQHDGRFSPLCAFPLAGNMMSVITPIQKVLLMFSPVQANPGTVVMHSSNPGLLIDLAGTNQRSVSFDINTGWSSGGGSWGQQIPANTDLSQLLLQ